MSRTKIESTTALEDLYEQYREDSPDAKELLEIITINLANFMTTAEYHEFVEHCINDR